MEIDKKSLMESIEEANQYDERLYFIDKILKRKNIELPRAEIELNEMLKIVGLSLRFVKNML